MQREGVDQVNDGIYTVERSLNKLKIIASRNLPL